MSTQKNLLTLCFATVFTLGLAACGGGGGGGGDDDAPVTGITDIAPAGPIPEAHACDAGASQDCVDARKADLDAIEDDADASLADYNAAKQALADAETNLADANTAMTEETTVSDAIGAAMTAIAGITDESASKAVSDGRAAIDAAKVSLDGMENLSAEAMATLQGRIDALNNDFSPIEMAATATAKTKAAGTKVEAIGKVMVADAFDAVDVTVTAKRTGPDIKVEGDDDFTHVMGPMYSLMHDADDDGNVVVEIVLVDHTITAPKRTSFAKAYPLDLSTDTTNDPAVGESTKEALTIATGVTTLVKSDSDAFAAGTGAGESIHRFDAENTTVDNMADAAEVAGTYDGAPGTYRCNGGEICTVTLMRDAMGEVSTTMSAGWIFTPDPGAKVYVVDREYASFGVWLKRTTDADGVLTYNMVDTFAMGPLPTTATAIAGVEGTATYAGSALGVYVHNVLDPAGEVASATGGMFTADAALTATFGQMKNEADPPQDTIAESMLDTITGTIDNFELAGGEAQKWSVELMRSESYDDLTDPTIVTFTGATKGGGEPGEYSGQFYGGTGNANDVAPGEVAGEFTANFLNGNVAGGFGATKQAD